MGRLVARVLRVAPEQGAPSFRRYTVLGLLAGVAVVAGAVAGGSGFVSHLPGAWFFGTPMGPLGSVSSNSSHPPALAVLFVYGGLVALAVVWWRLVRALLARPGTPVRQAVQVIAVWAVPFLLAPPLFSRDVYSYVGQGELAHFHIDPYHYGPGVMGATQFNILAGPLWANTPSPYGPTFLSIDGVTTALAGHHVLPSLVLLRLVAVIGIALIVAGLPTLARRVGHDPAAAVVLGAGSPLVLTTLIGGEHNDALMLGLLVAGLAVAERVGPFPGIVLCALGAGVKWPAALGVVAIGWNWPGPGARVPRRMVRTLGAMGIGAATMGALSALTGLGWGWTGTLGAPDKISTGVTPSDALSHAVHGLMTLAGSTVTGSEVRTVVTVLAMAAAGAVGTWLIWHSPRLGMVKALGLTLVVVAVASPVLWAWYATWGLALLAPVATGRLRLGMAWLAAIETLIGASSVLNMVKSLGHAGPLPFALVVVGVAAVALAVARCSMEVRPYGLRRSPWSGQRAVQPAGVTVTAIQRPHSPQ